MSGLHVTLFDNNSKYGMFYRNKYIIFNLQNYLVWDIERVIWIAFYQNNTNDRCYIKQLPKDVVQEILKMLKEINIIQIFETVMKRTTVASDLTTEIEKLLSIDINVAK